MCRVTDDVAKGAALRPLPTQSALSPHVAAGEWRATYPEGTRMNCLVITHPLHGREISRGTIENAISHISAYPMIFHNDRYNNGLGSPTNVTAYLMCLWYGLPFT
jgi:hypothetical protein